MTATNEPISALPLNSSPSSACLVPIVDPNNHSGAPTGTNEAVTVGNLLQNSVQVGGDIGGTAASPRVAKIQGVTISAPSGGSTRYLNAAGGWTTPAGGSGGSSVLDWVSVIAYGADPTGANDSTTAFVNAVAALPADGGIIYAPAGAYKISNTITFKQRQGLVGDGHTATMLNFSGTGSCITAANSGTFDGSAEGGVFAHFGVSGSYSGSSQIGMTVQDLQGIKVTDVIFYGLYGAGMYWTTAGSGWAEEAYVVGVSCIQCGVAGNNATGAVVFNSTSFDYGHYEFVIVTNPGAHAIVLQGGTNMNGCGLSIRGNMYCSTGNTAGVIAIDPGNSSGTSYLTNSLLNVSVETAGSGTGHYLVLMGSSNAASQFSGSGVLSIYPAFGNSQGISNPNYLPFGFSGIINYQDSYGNWSMSAGDGSAVMGGQVVPWQGAVNSALGGTVYTQFGNRWIGQLVSGSTNSVAFDGLGSLGKSIELFLQQPASGAAGTIGSWPSSVKWPGGTAPTLSTANSAVDWIHLEYMPPSVTGTSTGVFTAYLVAKGLTL